MNRKYLCICLTILIMVLLLLFIFYKAQMQPGVTIANAKRIECGMTLAEVEQLLGRSAQTDCMPPIQPDADVIPEYTKMLLWSDVECDVLIYLDATDRVVGINISWAPRGYWSDWFLEIFGEYDHTRETLHVELTSQ